MKYFSRSLVLITSVVFLSSCATTIDNTTDTIQVVQSTTSTIATPSGEIIDLLRQLSMVAEGLGQAVVDGDTSVSKAKVAEADAIWLVLEPQIRESGIDIVDSVQSIVRLIHTAAERKRPADADKALRFLPLVIEAVIPLLDK
jgi:uncharacterized phage infection (PIP) family protein YhgE